MHRDSELGEHIQRPLPTYLVPSAPRGLPGPAHHIRQAIPVIKDTHRLQAFPGLGHPHPH